MENKQQTEQEQQVLDTYNDDYWLKTYGVSAEELLQETKGAGIPARIIELAQKSHAFAL